MSKHSPNKLSNYLETHETVLEQFRRSGLIQDDSLALDALPGLFLMEGTIHLVGGIYIDVMKRISVLHKDGPNSLVQTSAYIYNVVLRGVGNIFRYCSPHRGHREESHVHRYDVLAGDLEGTVTMIYNEDDVPTLGEVVQEACDWYYEHFDFETKAYVRVEGRP